MNKTYIKDRNNRIIVKILTVFMIIMLASCSSGKEPQNDTPPEPNEPQNQVNAIIIDPELDAMFKDNYYYSQLTDLQKRIYTELYETASSLNTVYEPENITDDHDYDVLRALDAFDREHPEFFWVNNDVEYASRDGLLLKFSFEDTKTEGYELKEVYELILEFADNFNAYARDLEGEEQIRKIHDLICMNISYELGCPYSQDVRSALLNRKCVCAGYAKLFQLCMQRLGYDCYFAPGMGNTSRGSESHSWDFLIIDGKTYFVDVTWDDIDERNQISYEYFMKGSEFLNDHIYKEDRYNLLQPS